ncbi:hypothetical protein CYY_006876 [Polysphondylium violaceum]|uniref:Alpha-mannosidase n=1 Tax=Polysphondylium violaceum TaxID=133409 RepID=A0A8J4PPG3_9MYCE|nr:hypothetical protein CYY_006876 [Polysphondylium violaceum]
MNRGKIIFLGTLLVLLSIFIQLGNSVSYPANFKQKELKKNQPKLSSSLLNVHIVAHTHDDVGWLKTVDEYYYGANMSIQFSGVQYTLDSAISCLLANPDRKFIYVEVAFFERWWNEQSSSMQKSVANLVHNGQLEFINGGWCMNDEATTYYDDIIDQMSIGNQFLYDNFGVVPRVGWHIDPFGHSSTQATIFGAMGYDAFIIGRMDYQDIAARLETKNMEFMWRGSQSTPQYEIFTSVLRAMYCTPNGFDFEQGDTPVQDDPNLFNYNVEQVAENFVAVANEYATHYRTNNVLIPFGCDFAYMNANMYFKNIDKLIAHINANPTKYGIHLLYSTPSIYIDAVNKAGLTWDVKTDDLFPYSDDAHSYWTGYFTSRPALKGYVRQNNALLHILEQMLVTSQSNIQSAQSYVDQVIVMRQAMGVAQHHDAVSGTEMQHVADDYAMRLAIGNEQSLLALNKVIGQLLVSKPGGGSNANIVPSFTFCPLINQSICPSTDVLSSGVSVPVVFYNSLSWTRTDHVVIPIPIANVVVSDNSGNVQSQVTYTPSGAYQLEFYVYIPPLGYSSFVISPSSSAEDLEKYTHLSKETVYQSHQPLGGANSNIILENDYISVEFDGATGDIQSITNKSSNAQLAIQQDYQFYLPSLGDELSNQCSGAYIFRPIGENTYSYNNQSAQIKSANGPVVSYITRYWSDTMIQTYKLYANSEHLDIEEVIGPIDISDGTGKEVISRYTTNLNTNSKWYSDANGMEMQQRTLNYRPSWNYTIEEPISGNYVPVNSIAYIQDTDQQLQLTMLTDRSRGCASLANGEIEFMLHRRTLMDDGRGVREPMNESTQIITNSKLIFHDISSNAQSHYRKAQQGLAHPIYPMFTTTQESSAVWNNMYNSVFNPLAFDVPDGLKIQTLQWVDSTNSAILLRIQNIYQIDGQDHQDPQTISIDIGSLFSFLRVTSVTEMNLSAVEKISNVHRLKWNTNSNINNNNNSNKKPSNNNNVDSSYVFQITPMDIRTFIITLESN